jgi:hypothetical protein
MDPKEVEVSKMPEVGEIDPKELAERFRLVGEFFRGLSRPERVRSVIRSLQADGPEEFRRLMDEIPDFPGRCLTLCASVRNIVEGATVQEEERCALRVDLTTAERVFAWQIYERHFGPTRPEPVEVSGPGLHAIVLEIIPPGPYLDELKANNLVTCWSERVWVLTWSLGPPSWECIDLCLPE